MNHFVLMLQAEDKRKILVNDNVSFRISADHPSEEDLSTDEENNVKDNGDDSKNSAGAPNPQQPAVSTSTASKSDQR